MEIHKYKNILDMCPIPYIRGKRIDEGGNIRYIVKESNDLLIRKLELEDENDIIDKTLEDVLGISINEIKIFSKEKENKIIKYQYIYKMKNIYKITLNFYDKDEFYIWFEEYHLSSNYNLAIRNDLKAIIWIKDINGRYIQINKNFERIMKIESEQLIGKKNSEISIFKDFEYIEEYEQLILNKDEDIVEKIIFENGRWVTIFIYPMFDEDKNIIGTYGYKVYDYVRSKTLIGIENRNKMLEIIVDNLPIPIFYKDIQGVYLYCNEAFAELLEVDRNEIIGKKDYDLSTNDYNINIYKEADNKVIKHKLTTVYEIYLERREADKYIEITKVPLWDYKKKVTGIIGIVIDLTERKATERELEKLRLDFFSNLTHEFRTPLNLIFSSVQLIEQSIYKIKQVDINALIKYLGIIEQNGMRLLKLVNNLIDSTRIDSGCLDYIPKNHDIVSFVENICNSVVEFSKLQSIELTFDTDEEEKIIAFDSDKMERILLNLLSNAIKYNKDIGNIDVSIKCNDDYIDIKVKDTGIGIPNDKLEDIFEKFKQVDNRLTKVSEGSGIGLSIVKSLVDLHDGIISVKSDLGLGTEFKVSIPNKTILNQNLNYIKNESINMDKKIQIEFSDIY